MSAYDQILDWSRAKGQPDWRRDALRRLLMGPLGAKDEDEILEILKADHQLQETKLRTQPLLAEHLPAPGRDGDGVVLVELSDVQNTNRLAPEQRLQFGLNGVTLIYGDNGSGKSGYARILKKACRARVVEAILNNVFDPNPQRRPASATIEFSLGAETSPRSVQWKDGSPSADELARIAVFDSKCASVYVDSENQITFVPYSLDCFEKLARLCDRLRARLSTEYQALSASVAAQVLALPEGTVARAFLDSLKQKTDAECETATAWTDQDEARLKHLSTLVSNPEKRALDLRGLHAQIKPLRDAIDAVAPYLSDTGIADLKKKKAAAKAARQAAELAASETFPNEPLPGVGSSPWRLLYAAARTYSEQKAYVDREFPVVEGDARCVLCQQPLQEEAKVRMRHFDEFVRGELNRRAEIAESEWSAIAKAFVEVTSKLRPMPERTSNTLNAERVEVHAALDSYLSAAISLRDQVEKEVIDDGDAVLPHAPIISIGAIDKCLDDLSQEAGIAEKAASDEGSVKLRREYAELQARSLLHANKVQVIKRLTDLRRLDRLDAAMKACATTGISKKGTELLKEHVTATFENALATERKALGIVDIPLRLISSSPKGASSHKLKLDKATFSGNTSAILSEGEHRAVALAAFLAEQSMISGTAAIVVDDPVSSLDHERRQRVAKRLVEEGRKRQVIVFTHDLLLYMDASFLAAELQVPITKIGIRRGPNGYGTMDPDGDPWPAKILDARRNWLEKQYGRVKKIYVDGLTEEYEKEVRFLYDRLRETWERLIEEGLFANVVVRYRRSVETRRLTGAVLDDAFVMRVHNGMLAISEYTGHDRPAAAGAALPDPTVVRQHLDDLIACVAAVQQESKVADKRRTKLEKAPSIGATRI